MPAKMASRKRPVAMVYRPGLLSQQALYHEQHAGSHTESWVRDQERIQERIQSRAGHGLQERTLGGIQPLNGLGEVNVTIRSRSRPRTIIQLDNLLEGDSASQSSVRRHTPWPSFVQLTHRVLPQYPPNWYSTRETSFMGHRDEDVAEPEECQSMLRREIIPIMVEDDEEVNREAEAVLPSAKRRKIFHSTQYNSHIRGTPQQEEQEQLRSQLATLRPSPLGSRVQNASRPHASTSNATPQVKLTQRASQVTNILQPKSHLFVIAPEIRDKIYRYLLVKKNPINVTRLWTEAVRSSSRRLRGGLGQQPVAGADTIIDTRILRVCRQAAVEGTRILYSENKFRYMLRDSTLRNLSIGKRHTRSQIFNAIRVLRTRDHGVYSGRAINIEKYGHLLRNVSLELEPNRHESPYENLMVGALWSLVNFEPDTSGLAIPAWFPQGKIFLHTLSITISPENNRTGGMNVIPFFAEDHQIGMALSEIDTNFLNINVKLARPAKKRRRGVQAQAQAQDDDEDDADDEDDDDEDPVPRHLETTIDMRFLPRHLETLRDNEIDRNMWQNDKLIRQRRINLGHEAQLKLRVLDHRIRMATVDTEQAVRQGFWEDHFTAERRREMHRARDLALIEGVNEEEEEEEEEDSSEDPDSDDKDEDERRTRPRKSLIIHIQRFDGQLRSSRA
ncbi:hypothetical protein B0H67DRAFT_175026 [Lasiosphaeris hirsuta]|uniref:Uncharacterized protein n=1 Tax=Lasiosphaeris hirsuta TaxID=260670 RepID=A0AA40AQC8_9PEZI|nr:hypothetical protein B0H67DRAFT_175026 [Lasiosphaeris hirsuta]